MKISDAVIEAEGLNVLFKTVGKASVSFGKKVANSPIRALEIASNIATSVASGNFSRVLSVTVDLIIFPTTDEGFRVAQKVGVFSNYNEKV